MVTASVEQQHSKSCLMRPGLTLQLLLDEQLNTVSRTHTATHADQTHHISRRNLRKATKRHSVSLHHHHHHNKRHYQKVAGHNCNLS